MKLAITLILITTCLCVFTINAAQKEIPALPEAEKSTAIPRLSDADRLSLMAAQRDLSAALVKIADTKEQCRTATDNATKAAISKRDILQKLVDDLAPKGPANYTLDLDKAAYVPRKETAKAKQ